MLLCKLVEITGRSRGGSLVISILCSISWRREAVDTDSKKARLQEFDNALTSYSSDTMVDKVVMKELDSSEQDHIMDLFEGGPKYARFGEIGCLLPVSFKEGADFYKNMVVRSDDVFVASNPRSGTTWTSELVWLLVNDLDYDTASKVYSGDRCWYLELKHIKSALTSYTANSDPEAVKKCSEIRSTYEAVPDGVPSPRCLKTHLPISLLPSDVLETARIVYVARDPRDVAVSRYHVDRLLMRYSGDFKTYWNLFINDLAFHTPFFPHVKEAWALRDHPNMLFIFYEDMKRDLPSVIKRTANFLSKELTDEDVIKLCEYLDIKNFRKNESVNPQWVKKFGKPDAEGFVRKGISGGWREHFDEQMAAQAQAWMRENLAGSDLCFPDAS